MQHKKGGAIMSIGEKVKTKRMELDLTQVELSDRIGITQGMLCQIERGSKNPSLPICKLLAKEFNCEISDLIE